MGETDMTWDDVAKANIGDKKKPAPDGVGISAPPSLPQPSVIASPQASNKISIGKGATPTIYDNGGLPASVVQRGIDTMKGQLASPAQVAQAPAAVATSAAPVQQSAEEATAKAASVTPTKPIDMSSGPTVSDSAGGVYTPEKGAGAGIVSGIVNMFKDSATAARTGVHYDQVKADRQAAESASTQSAQNATQQPGNVVSDAMKSGQQSYAPGSVMANLTGDSPKQSIPGDALDRSKVIPNGRNENGVITAESAAQAYGNDMSRSGGIFGTIDMKGVNEIMARENKARGEMIDSMIRAQGGNGIAILPDNTPQQSKGPSIDELRSAMKSARTRTERAAYGQMLNQMISGQNQLAQEQIRQQGIAAGHGIQMRGQDLTAQNEAARLAGNPLDNQIKQNQIASGTMANASVKQLQDLHAAYGAETDPAKRKVISENIRALSGKDPASRYTVIPGGEYVDPENPLVKMKAKPSVLDNSTGQIIDAPSSGAGNKKSTPVAGEVRGGYRFKGGNPADQNAWEKV